MAHARHTLALAAALTACSSPYPKPPETRVETVVDTLHGVAFADDYRWLEDQDAPETRAWIAAQNAYAESIVGASPLRDSLEARLRALLDRDDVGTPRKAGGWEYFSMVRQGEEMGRVYRRPAPGGEDAEDPSPTEEYEVVLDPAAFHPEYRVVLEMGDVSPDGRYLLYNVRQGGADEVEVRVRDLDAGEDLPDRLPAALYGGVDWDGDSRGFTYVHRDRYRGPRIRHHALGSDVAGDPVVWGEGYEPTAFVGTTLTGDGRWRLFNAGHGWARSEWHIQDVRAAGPVRPVVEDIPAHFQIRYHEGKLYVLTDWNASNYRLMTADPAHPEPEAWSELIPEGEDVLQGYTFLDGSIYATYLHEVEDRIRVFGMDGSPQGELDVPAASSVTLRAAGDGKAELTVTGYLRPSRTWTLDLASGTRTLTDSADVPFDTTGTVVTKLWYSSADGTRAPLYVMHKAGLRMDGSNPTILNGYGGFNVAIEPGFSPVQAAWVEMGGVYAVATLRGGSEFGEDWHRAGMLENKPNVFADFVAAAEHLVSAGYTSPEHLGISGGSNGGLLVAAAMTARPDLFRAVLCTYPDLDMVRFWAFQDANNVPALLEYGDARDPRHFEAIRAYSPYQAVRNRVKYPAVMLATGDLDTRVPPLQARRMTARLQAATRSGLPVVLWYDEWGGHAAGRGRPTSLRVRDAARELAFLGMMLGLSGSG
ncbi:MAG: oligopeptidase B [Gemmatimonadota bacterium]